MIDHDARDIRGMILAAGYGTRMRPLTEVLPKPLAPLANGSLIADILARTAGAGVGRWVVNAHHLAGQLEKYLAECPRRDNINFLPETEILGTGGPLVNAKPFLADADAILLHNGDILSDIDLRGAVQRHFAAGALATMVCRPGPENRVLCVDGRVRDILGKLKMDEAGGEMLTYCGIAVLSPGIYEYLPSEPVNCSIITAIIEAMADGGKIAVHRADDDYWNDLGTIGQYLRGLKDLNSGKCAPPPLIDGFPAASATTLREQGSNRSFTRLRLGGESMIMMASDESDQDFDRFIDYGRFFSELKLNTPEIIAVSRDNRCVLVEDLGGETVRAKFQSRPPVDILKKAVGRLIDLQCLVTAETAAGAGPEFRLFDYDYLRWETTYFKENLLGVHWGMDDAEMVGLDAEFDYLARLADALPKVLIHRDFQSENIVVGTDGGLGFVDFQGARVGPYAYDIMSLSMDPYIELDDDQRFELRRFYHRGITGRDDCPPALRHINSAEFADNSNLVGLQRIMQALGAFGFLGHRRGKPAYLEHIPRGSRHLRLLLDERKRLGGFFPEVLNGLLETKAGN